MVDRAVAGKRKGTPPDWFPDWRGETAVIVASGPSAKDQPLESARGRCRFIAVNQSWELAPWADILYGCDFRWWKAHDGVPKFEGLKVCIDVNATVKDENNKRWGVQHIICEKNTDELLLHAGKIGWGANSGFGAINIAAQLHVSSIILVGFDMSLHAGEHWHGIHPPKLGNPRESQLPRWRRSVDNAAPILAEIGIKVWNTALISGLKAYPQLTFSEALAAAGC